MYAAEMYLQIKSNELVTVMHQLFSWVIAIFQTLNGQIYNLLLIMITTICSTCFSMFKTVLFDQLISEHTTPIQWQRFTT